MLDRCFDRVTTGLSAQLPDLTILNTLVCVLSRHGAALVAP